MSGKLTVIVCRGPVCRDLRGSAALEAHLRATIAARKLEDRVAVDHEVCFGHCLRGPNILVQSGAGPEGGVLYNRMTAADLDQVVERHLLGGMVVRVLTNRPPVRGR